MALINLSEFVGEINIPNTDEPAVQESLTVLIAKYQPRFYKALIGSVLYAEYDPEQPIWEAFDELVHDALLYYIYYWYIRNTASKVSNTGTSTAKQENATTISPGDRMVFAWNEMVDMVREIRDGWDVELYGEWYLRGKWYGLPDIFYKQNTLNI